jgi:phage tail sheath gpL-like
MPSNITASSLAAANGVGVKNVQFSPSANTLARKILLIGTYDETTKTSIVPDVPLLVTSKEDVGDRLGFGFMLYRLAKSAFIGSSGIETWVVPQEENVAAAFAQGSITVTASSASAGTLYLYIAGESVQVTVADGDDGDAIASSINAAINADNTLPVTSTVALSVVTVDSKAGGLWGNFINMSLNWGAGEETPADITSIVFVQLTGGSGLPDIQTALDALGTGDEQNLAYFTDLVHGYMQDATTLDDLSIWNGEGNAFAGNYAKLVARPLRSLNGDTAAGSGGLSALIAVGDGRKQDRTSGIIAAPGSPNHPQEIAALAMGIMAQINANRASEHYVGRVLSGVITGAPADRWTSSYTSRDTALKAGISSTLVSGGSVLMQDVATFYHPDSVPVDSNGYAYQVNISKLQNISNSVKINFGQEKWQGNAIVADVSKVTSVIDREKTKDITAVQNDVVALAVAWASRSWIFNSSYTISEIQKGTYIEIRPGGTGFNIVIPILLSGVSRITNTEVKFDTSFAILTV